MNFQTGPILVEPNIKLNSFLAKVELLLLKWFLCALHYWKEGNVQASTMFAAKFWVRQLYIKKIIGRLRFGTVYNLLDGAPKEKEEWYSKRTRCQPTNAEELWDCGSRFWDSFKLNIGEVQRERLGKLYY